jgi:MFS family permease
MVASDVNPTPQAGDRAFVAVAGAMLAAQTLTAFAWQAIPVLAPAASVSYDIADEYIGFLTSVVYLFAMVSALVGGSMATRFGAITVSQRALLCCAIGALLFGVGNSWTIILVGVLIGCGYGPPTPASSQVLARVTPPRLANVVFSIKQTGIPLGGVLAGATVPWIERLWGWQIAAFCVTLACVALAFAFQPLRQKYDIESKLNAHAPTPRLRDFIRPVGEVWRRPQLRRLALASTFFSATQGALSTFIVIYGVNHLHMSLVEAGALASVLALSGIVGRIGWGIVAEITRKPRHVLLGFAVSMTVGLTALALAAYYGLVIFLGLTAISWTGVYVAEIARLAPPGRAGEITGGTVVFTFAGPLISPALFSIALVITNSYAWGFGLLAAGTFAAIILMLLVLRDASVEEPDQRPAS